MVQVSRSCTLALCLLAAMAAAQALAGFSGSDLFLPMVGRQPGVFPSDWYTTVWVYNPSADTVVARLYLLERNTANPTPPWVDVTVPPGDTLVLENVVESLFHAQVFGALRVTAPGKLVVTSRVYSRGPAAGARDSVGQDFAGVPASFAIGVGERTQVLGTYQTLPSADSEFRFNFGFVETTGHSATVRVRAFDSTGTEQGSKDVQVREFSQRQGAFKDYFPTVSTENTRLEMEVVSGTGRIIAYGSGIANGSQDPTTYEMQYSDTLLGIANIQHDATLKGDGSAGAPLGIAEGGVGTSLLPDLAITADKLADEAVTVHKLATVPSPLPSPLQVSAMRDIPLEAFFKTGDTMFWAPAFIGDITTIFTDPGSGLTGGVTIGDAHLAVAPLGVTNGMLADRAVNAAKLDVDPPGSTAEKILKRNQNTGGFYWGVDGIDLWPFQAMFQQPFSPVSPYVFRIENVIGAISIDGSADTGTGLSGTSDSGIGVLAESVTGSAVSATNTGNSGSAGVFESLQGRNLDATVNAIHHGTGPAVRGEHQATGHLGYLGSNGYGAYGGSPSLAWGYLGGATAGAYGRRFTSSGAEGLLGTSDAGVKGLGNDIFTDGVYGSTAGGVWGALGHHGNPLTGVYGYNESGGGKVGYLASVNEGAYGRSNGNVGMLGAYSWGAYGEHESNGNYGYLGSGDYGALGRRGDDSSVGYLGGNQGVYGRCSVGGGRYAGYFAGPAYFSGAITKAGGGFQIDHPLDPQEKVLNHSFVESPDMKDLYDGVVTTDENGLAVVDLPAWFEALNRDFRYQLTVIGRFAQAIVERKVEGGRFTIRTNLANVEVSWQVTGIRKDPWANANRIAVEEEKPASERGTYLHPDAYGVSEELSVERVRNPESRSAEAASGATATAEQHDNPDR